MKNSHYREFDIFNLLDNYLYEHIGYAGTLGKFLLSEKDISRAKKVTLLHENTPLDIIDKEEEWTLDMASLNASLSWLVKKIQDFLKSDRQRIVLCYNLSDPSFEFMKKSKLPKLIYNKEVYHPIRADKADDSGYIEKAIKFSESPWSFTGVMSSVSEMHPVRTENVDEEIVRLFARRTEHIFVSCFDGCGYIICSFNDKTQ